MKQGKSKTRRGPKRASVKRFEPNDAKFKELVIFIASRSENDPRFGAIKLNKLLFYCDFVAYQRLGRPITGQEYFALKQGPAPRYGTRIRQEMEAAREIAIQNRETEAGPQIRTVALRKPNLKNFSSEEIALVTQVLQEYRASSGTDLSEKSHKFAGWSLAKERETIPYTVALVGNRFPTHDEIQRGVVLQATAEGCLAEHAARGNT
jgi:uncharacterized phage-associated protein